MQTSKKIEQLEEHLNFAGQYFSKERFDKVMKIIMEEFGAKDADQ